MEKNIYDFKAQTIDGDTVTLNQYKGKVILIVNTASKCGFTPQYKGLQLLYEKYRDQGFEILAFPSNQFKNQEPGTAEEIKNFCTVYYNASFPLFSKIDVNGPSAHPLYKHLVKAAPGVLNTEAIKWNFTKFLIDRDGTVFKRYAPKVKPEKIIPDIEYLL